MEDRVIDISNDIDIVEDKPKSVIYSRVDPVSNTTIFSYIKQHGRCYFVSIGDENIASTPIFNVLGIIKVFLEYSKRSNFNIFEKYFPLYSNTYNSTYIMLGGKKIRYHQVDIAYLMYLADEADLFDSPKEREFDNLVLLRMAYEAFFNQWLDVPDLLLDTISTMAELDEMFESIDARMSTSTDTPTN